jgi:hypothetical protein
MFGPFIMTREERAKLEQERQARHQAELDACQAERDKKLEKWKDHFRSRISEAVVARKRFLNLGPHGEPFLEAIIAVANEEESWVLDVHVHSVDYHYKVFDSATQVLLKLAVVPKPC